MPPSQRKVLARSPGRIARGCQTFGPDLVWLPFAECDLFFSPARSLAAPHSRAEWEESPGLLLGQSMPIAFRGKTRSCMMTVLDLGIPCSLPANQRS